MGGLRLKEGIKMKDGTDGRSLGLVAPDFSTYVYVGQQGYALDKIDMVAQHLMSELENKTSYIDSVKESSILL